MIDNMLKANDNVELLSESVILCVRPKVDSFVFIFLTNNQMHYSWKRYPLFTQLLCVFIAQCFC